VEKAPDAFRTISEVADELDVPQHVLRFWETRFAQIRPMKRGGGRRYYRPDDVDLLRGIRHLLYGQGYTIRGVQRLLKDNGVKYVQGVWRPDSAPPPPEVASDADGADDDSAEFSASADDVAVAAPRARAAPARAVPASADDRESADAEASDEDEESASGEGIDEGETDGSSPAVAASAVRPRAGLTDEQREALLRAAAELAECRKLLDEALKDE